MIINHKYKFAFIHVPKTGGTSVRVALSEIEGSEKIGVHRNAKQSKNILGDLWDGYFKFAFVRNPFSRTVSWYNHILWEMENGFKKENINNPGTFENFVKNYTEIYNHKKSDDFILRGNQIDFLSDEDGFNINVFRFETLEHDFPCVCETLGIRSLKLKWLKHCTKNDWRNYYTEELKQIIEDRFKKDIEAFGYVF